MAKYGNLQIIRQLTDNLKLKKSRHFDEGRKMYRFLNCKIYSTNILRTFVLVLRTLYLTLHRLYKKNS